MGQADKDEQSSSKSVGEETSTDTAKDEDIINGDISFKKTAVTDEEEAWKDVLGDDKPWSSFTTKEKVQRVILNTVKCLAAIGCLYLFICSLELLSSSFSLISGKSTGAVLNNEYTDNPIVGLMIGILLTVLVQSSSTSTSIIVSMVAADMLTVNEAIPMIMGSNIGTSVTNTIVSLTQVGNKENFRRAFAGATVHDMFNWLSVLVLLPIEVATGLLETITGALVDKMSDKEGADIEFLEVITEPFTSLFIQLNNQVIQCWAAGYMQDVDSMIKEYCRYENNTMNTTVTTPPPDLTTPPIYFNYTEDYVPPVCQYIIIGIPDSCRFLFYHTKLSDQAVGGILLLMSLFILCASLILIVKILNSLLKGSIAKIIRKVINADIPYVPWLTGYIALLIGAFLTFLVQSSSVFTSTLTPLIGIGIISVERAYPLTLGSNLGTTTTALLASLAVVGNGSAAVQVALVHLFFNVFGILLYYPVPFMRFPIPMCQALGKITSEYRWFAIVYLVGMFFVLPISVFALSMGGPAVLWGVLVPILVLLLIVIIINIMQRKCPRFLPNKLKDWEFLPTPLHSLEPYDKVLTAPACCKKCRGDEETAIEEAIVETVQDAKKLLRRLSSNFSTNSNQYKVEGIDNPSVIVEEQISSL